jgi:hypothetical protein
VSQASTVRRPLAVCLVTLSLLLLLLLLLHGQSLC